MIRQGDMVRVGVEQPLHGIVKSTSREGERRGHLKIEVVCGSSTVREVLSRDVTRHWRLVRPR